MGGTENGGGVVVYGLLLWSSTSRIFPRGFGFFSEFQQATPEYNSITARAFVEAYGFIAYP